jgi:carbonic anhydrase
MTDQTTHSTLPAVLAQGYDNFRGQRYTSEAERYEKLASKGQKPKVMIIACCDSRAAPETIFDAGPGELFVVRNVANLVPPYAPDEKHHSTSAALEFAVNALKVEHIVVMGHGKCGGIASVVTDFTPLTNSDFIGKWMADVQDVAGSVSVPEGTPVHEHCKMVEHASVEHSLANLRTFPWIRSRIQSGELSIHGAWFDIALGELHVYDEAANQWSVQQAQAAAAA